MEPVIRAATPYSVVEDASRRYKGVIPPDRWKEPYMHGDELIHEIRAGVEFWVFEDYSGITGIMGLHDRGDVHLIRHAYVLTDRQGKKVGTRLLEFLYARTTMPVLSGCPIHNARCL